MTTASNWRDANPDLISFSQVTGVDTDIHVNKTEIYYKDDEGRSKSYNPRRYEYDYEFHVTILVDSPWFDKIELELSSGNRSDSPYTNLYRQYEEQMHTLFLRKLRGKKTVEPCVKRPGGTAGHGRRCRASGILIRRKDVI